MGILDCAMQAQKEEGFYKGEGNFAAAEERVVRAKKALEDFQAAQQNKVA